MTTIVLGCDSNGNNVKYQNTVENILRKAGYKVEKLSIGPTPFGSYGYQSRAKGKIGIYLMAASLTSVTDLGSSGWKFKYTYFGIRADVSDWNTEKKFNTWGVHKDHEGDCTNVFCDRWQGKTYPQINQIIANKGKVLFAENATNFANKVLQELGNPQAAYSTTSDGKGGYQSSYSGSLQGNSDSNISPLLQGEMTFEELVGEICHGIDLMFLCKRSTVVVTDFSTIFAEAEYLRKNHYSAIADEDIHFWQLEEDSYELNVNNHAFYNTVYVEYKNGTVKEQFLDLAHIFGEVSITYKDKKVDKTTAQMKAKSYLAAHLRDFELTVEASMLTEGNIDIGDIVTLDNPHTLPNQTKSAQGGLPEYLFVKGVNTNWEGDGYITSDLELQFSPTSPSKKEVPTAGTWGTTNNVANE
ncbi:MAG: hypothetical protein J6B87_07215 [Clostridia bacterium]|nr:hypothetical protein [Clostridia bacterium]